MSDFNKVAKSYVKMSCSKRQITENNWLFMSIPCVNLNDPCLSAPSRCWLCFICNFGNVCLWILQLLHCVSCDNLRLNAERHLGCCCVYLVVKKSSSLTFSSLLCATSQVLRCISIGFSLRQSRSQLAYLANGNIYLDVAVVIQKQRACPHWLRTVPLHKVT